MTLSAIEGVLTPAQIKATLEEAGMKPNRSRFQWADKWNGEAQIIVYIKWRYRNLTRTATTVRSDPEYFARVVMIWGDIHDCHDLASLRKAVGL